jgi:Tol biopolymer transport system component
MRLLVLLTALIAHSAIAAPSVTDIVISEGTNFAIDIAPPGVAGDRQLLIDLQGILWLLPAGGGTGQPLNAPEADLRLPRVSPDGSLITFQWFINGAWHIGVMKPDGSGLSQLTSGAPDDHGPVWSTDGSAILFSSDRAGNFDLWSFDLAGEALTQVTHNAADDFAPAVSPDGRHLAFLSDRSGKPALYLQTGDGPAEKIADAPAGRLYTPRFSPTGSHIAFVQADERLAFPAIARNRLVAIDLSAGEQITVSTDTEDVFGFAPAWLDNETLIYAADGQIRERRLGSTASADIPFRVKLSLQRSDLEPNTSERFPQRKQPVRGIVNPVTTPDGNRIIFTALGDLWVRHRDGRLEQLTNDVFVERDPDISHDNTQLAFISDRAGDMQIWIRNLLDDRDRQLTSNSRGPRYPTFDHSGTRLAYQQVGPRGTQDFTVHAYLTVAALTSTSKRFREGVNQLVRIHVDDDKAQLNELPDAQVVDFGPVASPGGAQTALIIDGALWRVATAPDGSFAGPPERVLDELADYPSWTANARQIVFLSNRGLETLDVENQRRKHLAIDLDWQPAQSSGRRIVHAGKLFDGVDANYRDNIDITIDGATIVSVRPHEAHPENIEVIDARKISKSSTPAAAPCCRA